MERKIKYRVEEAKEKERIINEKDEENKRLEREVD
jgi:hypothetical protein